MGQEEEQLWQLDLEGAQEAEEDQREARTSHREILAKELVKESNKSPSDMDSEDNISEKSGESVDEQETERRKKLKTKADNDFFNFELAKELRRNYIVDMKQEDKKEIAALW